MHQGMLDLKLFCRQHMSSIKAFLGATAQGYQYAAAHPQEAAALLVEESKGTLDKDFAVKSQESVSKVRARPARTPSRCVSNLD